jgi:PAS domain S-box-containing protein
MSGHDLLQSLEQARQRLDTLCARLEDDRMAPWSPEIKGALRELQEMLEKLQERYELMREILARADDAVFAKDQDGRYVMINRNGAGMFGKSVEEILGEDDTALFERELAERIMAIDRVVMKTGRSRTFEETMDILGIPTTLLTTETAWYEPGGRLRGLIGTAQDVTRRKRAELGAEVQQDRLRSLVSEIVIAEERLRQSLAADLHSGLGQDIALAKMKLSALRGSSSADLHDPLARIERLVEHADRSLRAITFQLSPPSLHDLGLVPALEWLAEDIGGRYGLDVRIEDQASPAVADERIRVVLFRAVRELVLNAATHAGAREARVWLGSEESLLRITVEDEGTGFDAAGVDSRGHGLFGIREQLKHLGGSMHIDSAPGRGTTVALTVPLATGGTAST